MSDHFERWLAGRERQALHLPEFRQAAVLVGLTLEDDPRILLTVRASNLPTHQGQISFPGGSLESGETAVQAAVREAHEEVGLHPAGVQVLGLLDDVFTPMKFHVTPVLARLPAELSLTPTPEVAEILLPRLSELRAIRPRSEERISPLGQPITVWHYLWHGHDIWGMTARVLRDVLEMEDRS
ncbi:NUDIX hydrolase [Deinococcus ruber]|uniref:Coenzyme A pyrophosphatase n=1 Tax=Deinococcus ruber TaxID=1848197 RepID=A0A918CLK5_9DEIO|nr:CoA pyrophosphatase [Deinococcus ruber]GGR29608.1 coenzyme A pyrophosphatase [Deinococcus ruber]